MKKHIGQLPGWIVSRHFLYLFVFLLLQIVCLAQINTGSDGSDGPFNPTAANTVINMASHPDGIYQYTSVNIPANVTVTFTPNANNTPVVWLVQGNVVINGTLAVDGSSAVDTAEGLGGPGGYRGGGGPAASSGQGPGGGLFGPWGGGHASYGALGGVNNGVPPGPTYGNTFLIPLLGGSGGGGTTNNGGGFGGGGGGGALLIAASGVITMSGGIQALGGAGATAAGEVEERSASWLQRLPGAER